MGTIRKRLERGERWWAAELVLRIAGLALLGLFVVAVRTVCRLAASQQGTPLEALVAFGAYFCLATGLALLIAGPGLFQLMPKPPRALLP